MIDQQRVAHPSFMLIFRECGPVAQPVVCPGWCGHAGSSMETVSFHYFCKKEQFDDNYLNNKKMVYQRGQMTFHTSTQAIPFG